MVVILLMMVGGIGLTQAVSDPHQVSLRWLRLGGLIAVALLAVAAVAAVTIGTESSRAKLSWIALVAIPCVTQLMMVQIGWRRSQAISALIGFILTAMAVSALMMPMHTTSGSAPNAFTRPPTPPSQVVTVTTCVLASGLLGGFLMTMLLGHAYLTAGNEMTQRPFLRLVVMLGVLLVVRLVATTGFALWPYLMALGMGRPWDIMMIISRLLVGLVVPGVFTYMIYDCVKRRANQSATGILYVALVLVIIGEGTAMTLVDQTGYAF